jgi:glyoxylase-like metal-dependent hydrolase (beta-lactamase superfamily II)
VNPLRLYAFHAGGELVPMSVLSPFAEHPGEIVEIPYFFYLVQHDQGNVLFDTGAHPSLATNPSARLGAAAELFEIRMAETDGAVDQLSTIGIKPEDIHYVVQSHLHYDHAGGLEFFPSAPVLAQRTELAFARQPPIYQRDIYVPADFKDVKDWHQLEGEHDLFDDGRIIALPTPGHTPGHQSLLVRLAGQTVILVADAAYMRASLEESILPGLLWSPDAMVESWERLRRLRDEHSATLLLTHDREYPTTTRLAPDAWYE